MQSLDMRKNWMRALFALSLILIALGVFLGGVENRPTLAWIATAVGGLAGGSWAVLRTPSARAASGPSSRLTPAYWLSFAFGLAVYVIGGIEHAGAFVVFLPLVIVSFLGALGAERLKRASDEMYWKGTEAVRQVAVAWAVLLLWGLAGMFNPGKHGNDPLATTAIAFLLFAVVIVAGGSGVSNYVAARQSIPPVDTSGPDLQQRRKEAWERLNRRW